MKNGKIKWLPLLLACAMAAALLSGCGGAQYNSGGSVAKSTPSEANYDTQAAYSMDGASGGWAEAPTDAPAPEPVSAPAVPANIKMIYTADISMESTQFDAAVEQLEALVAEKRGWMERSSFDNNSRNYRRAYFTVRVPAEQFDSFCASVGNLCNILSINRSMEDVSEIYYDNEARLATQRTKLARLQELLAQATSMEDIITLESAISETELAIEQLTGTLRHYDSLVGYSTISITLSEVFQLTEVEEPVIGFGAKLAEAFRSGSRGFVSWAQGALLDLARNWVGWLIFLVICAGIAFLIVSGVRRSKKRRAAARAFPPPQPPRPQQPAPQQPITPQKQNPAPQKPEGGEQSK